MIFQQAGSVMIVGESACIGILIWRKEDVHRSSGTRALFDPLLHATLNSVSLWLSYGPEYIVGPRVIDRGLSAFFLPEKPWGWASSGLTRESILC
jgi:hypothetical protein